MSFSVEESAKYLMLLRYSLYHLDWYSTILPQGRENVHWSGSTNMQLYLKINDQPLQWLFTLNIKDSSGNVIKTSSFSIGDLSLGNDNSWLSPSSIELLAGKTYSFSLSYASTSNNYGAPWPLLLDSFILMLDYNWATYFTTMSSVAIKEEIQVCFQSSRSLATTYNLPAHCGLHTFTIDLQLYNRALGMCAVNIFISW